MSLCCTSDALRDALEDKLVSSESEIEALLMRLFVNYLGDEAQVSTTQIMLRMASDELDADAATIAGQGELDEMFGGSDWMSIAACVLLGITCCVMVPVLWLFYSRRRQAAKANEIAMTELTTVPTISVNQLSNAPGETCAEARGDLTPPSLIDNDHEEMYDRPRNVTIGDVPRVPKPSEGTCTMPPSM